jgi:hypothetical protein
MLDIDEDVSEEWKKPSEGFNDDIDEDEEFETTRFGMNTVDRLISSIGEKQLT